MRLVTFDQQHAAFNLIATETALRNAGETVLRTQAYLALTLVFLMSTCLATKVAVAQEQAQVDRTELPQKGPWYPPITTLDARDATAPPVFEVKAPRERPTSWSFCSTIWASAEPVPLEA